MSTAPSETVSGTVTDGSGAGWPLYAKLVITATGAPVFTVFTDPVTGELLRPARHRQHLPLRHHDGGAGLHTGRRPLAARSGGRRGRRCRLGARRGCDDLQRAGLQPYRASGGFDAGVVPPGWLLVTPSGAPWSVLTEDPCGTFQNSTGGSGPFAVSKTGCPTRCSTTTSSARRRWT